MQRDLVLRWIEQLGRLVARLVGLGGKAELGAARDQVAEATINLLGPLSLLVPRLETSSAAELLADPDRIFGYAQLLDLDGTISEGMGEKDAATESRRMIVCERSEPVDTIAAGTSQISSSRST